MGVDISYLTNVRFVSDDYPEGESGAGTFVYPNHSFPGRCDLARGYYAGDESGDVMSSSYSGYSKFREMLCLAVLGVTPEVVWDNYEQFRGRPLAELIHFSDCEGALDGKTCAKLASDFRDLRWFANTILKWADATEAAANTGVITFH